MRRASVQRTGSYTVAILLLAELAWAGPLDRGARLCLHSPNLPIENAAADPRTKDLQTRLIAALEAAGFAVADPSAVDAVVERVVKQGDGVFDPYTGRWDRTRAVARRAALANALQTELSCQVRMLAEVRPVFAHFNGSAAYWDGQKDAVLSDGRSALNGLNGVTEYGFVPALSLWLRVLDAGGEEIAFRSAGIETLVSFAVMKEQDVLPQDRWLMDKEKIDAAIQSALGANGSYLRFEGNPHWNVPPS